MSNELFGQVTPTKAVAVTPDDTGANIYKMLYVGGAGNVKIKDQAGNTTTFVSVPAGQYIFCQTQLVYSTDTTATGIVGIG